MRTGKLYTSYFTRIKQGKGIKISIARYNPKWLNTNEIDEWFRDLAPSIELLNDYKYKGISWEEYEVRYIAWLKYAYLSNPTVSKMFNSICSILDSGEDVTLYCYEKATDNCHRHLLGKLMEYIGYEVEEI